MSNLTYQVILVVMLVYSPLSDIIVLTFYPSLITDKGHKGTIIIAVSFSIVSIGIIFIVIVAYFIWIKDSKSGKYHCCGIWNNTYLIFATSAKL